MASDRAGGPMTRPGLHSISEIIPHLYLSDLTGNREERLRELNISLVINASMNIQNANCDPVVFHRIYINDSPYENIGTHLDEVTDKIEEFISSDRNVLVHCMAGVSRSSTIVLAYLIKHNKMSLRDAFVYATSRRSCIRPNQSFFKQLIEFEEKIHGRTSVKIVKIKGLDGMSIEVPDLYATDYKKMGILEAIVAKVHKDKANLARYRLSLASSKNKPTKES